MSPTARAPRHPTTELPAKRFGWFGGVFTPSILTILGVVMYLRLGWVVGHAGLGGALFIVVVSHLISVATALSVTAIATNRTVGPGGAYYMTSRSLGAAAGAAIGIPLFLGQALSVAFYVVGFVETLQYLWPHLPPKTTATGICAALTLLAMRSAEATIRTQYVVMAAIGVSLVSIFAGGAVEPVERIPWWSDRAVHMSEVFAVFFPAVTGIMAGVSMSGELRQPRRAIPLGTLAAVAVGFLVYAALPVWLAHHVPAETLRHDSRVLWDISAIPTLVYLGVWGATLSSAIGSVLTAPRTLQALARDGLMPRVFAQMSGDPPEPRAGLVCTFVLAEAGILLGSLDAIAPVLTMFFLATYGMTNLACGLERWARSPSFRPSFAVPAWVSLGGAVACFYAMSIVNLPAMLASLLVYGAIFVAVERRQLDTTYGDARHGIWAALVRTALLQLRRLAFHPSNWRPNLVILGGNPDKRRYLLELGSAIVQQRGMVTYFHLLTGTVRQRARDRARLLDELGRAITTAFPTVFYRVDIVPDLYTGAVQVVQTYGLGTFEANTVLLGWPTATRDAPGYVRMLEDLLLLDRSLLVVRHDPSRGFGRRRTIDVWWGGMRPNGALMLLLAHLLTAHDPWLGARVRIVVVTDAAQEVARLRAELVRIVQAARLQAEPVVLVRNGRSIAALMRTHSADADLVVAGMRTPRPGERPEDFIGHYDTLLAGMPSVVLVRSAHGFEGTPVLFDETEPDVSDAAAPSTLATVPVVPPEDRSHDDPRMQEHCP